MASYCHYSEQLQHSQSLIDLHLDCNPNQVHAMIYVEDVSAHKMLLGQEVMSPASKATYLHSGLKQKNNGQIQINQVIYLSEKMG